MHRSASPHANRSVAKNAILIIEFAKLRVDAANRCYSRHRSGTPAFQADHYDIHVLYLWRVAAGICHGRRRRSRNTIGIAVLGGMIASSTISVTVVPVLFVLFTRLIRQNNSNGCRTIHEELMEKQRKLKRPT